MARDRFAEEAERLNRKARQLLNHAGWDASRAALEKELVENEAIIYDAEDRHDIVTRAIGLQLETRRQTELRLAAPAPAPAIPTEEAMPSTERINTADEAREFLREQRAQNPDLDIPGARDLLREKFGIDVKYASFYNTYWMKSAPPKRGRPKNGAKSVAKKRRATAVVRSADRPPPALIAKTNGAGVVTGDPILQIFELPDGKFRVQFDMSPDLGNALQAVGAALNARKAHTNGN